MFRQIAYPVKPIFSANPIGPSLFLENGVLTQAFLGIDTLYPIIGVDNLVMTVSLSRALALNEAVYVSLFVPCKRGSSNYLVINGYGALYMQVPLFTFIYGYENCMYSVIPNVFGKSELIDFENEGNIHLGWDNNEAHYTVQDLYHEEGAFGWDAIPNPVQYNGEELYHLDFANTGTIPELSVANLMSGDILRIFPYIRFYGNLAEGGDDVSIEVEFSEMV